MTSSALLLLTVLSAAAPKLAVLNLSAGEGVSQSVADSVTEAWVAELRKHHAGDFLTGKELLAMLSLERQKQLLGCANNECMVEVASALDAEQLILGSLSRLGQSWMFQVQRVDLKTSRTVASASRRKKGGSIDDVLDELPSAAQELFGTKAPAVAVNTVPLPVAVPTSVALPAASKDVALTSEVDKAALTVLTDGKGQFVAVKPFSLDGPLFSGTKDNLYLQRTFGGGSEGTKSFGVVFWEPHARYPAEASFDFRDDKYSLTCGEKNIPLTKLSAVAAKKFLASAKLWDVRWRRRAYALARDDDGNYVYVDQARLPEGNQDFHLYLGAKGKLRGELADVLAHDNAGDLFRTGAGKLKMSARSKKAEWVTAAGVTQLTVLPVEDHARFIYSELNAYPGQSLGTLCDQRW